MHFGRLRLYIGLLIDCGIRDSRKDARGRWRLGLCHLPHVIAYRQATPCGVVTIAPQIRALQVRRLPVPCMRAGYACRGTMRMAPRAVRPVSAAMMPNHCMMRAHMVRCMDMLGCLRHQKSRLNAVKEERKAEKMTKGTN